MNKIRIVRLGPGIDSNSRGEIKRSDGNGECITFRDLEIGFSFLPLRFLPRRFSFYPVPGNKFTQKSGTVYGETLIIASGSPKVLLLRGIADTRVHETKRDISEEKYFPALLFSRDALRRGE